jgi:hypothetical protein
VILLDDPLLWMHVYYVEAKVVSDDAMEEVNVIDIDVAEVDVEDHSRQDAVDTLVVGMSRDEEGIHIRTVDRVDQVDHHDFPIPSVHLNATAVAGTEDRSRMEGVGTCTPAVEDCSADCSCHEMRMIWSMCPDQDCQCHNPR